MNKKFLHELLKTPSPSGYEKDLQLKWLNYTKEFAHKSYSDMSGNVYAVINPEANFKILLAGHGDEIGLMVNTIDDKGFVYFTKLGGIGAKPALGQEVMIMGYAGENIYGVFGCSAEHHGGAKGELKFSNLYLDCGFKNKIEALEYIKTGDLAIYNLEPKELKNDLLTSKALDNKTGSFIVAEIIKELSKHKVEVGVYGVSTVNEETNQGGAYFAASQIKPNMALALDVTFATDYPDVDKKEHGDIKLEGGPVLAKGSPINWKINKYLEESAERLKMNLQYELTPRNTGTDADTIRKTGAGVPIALVSLPLRYMHSPVETCSYKDIEDEIKLMVDFIINLTPNTCLDPLK